MMDTYLVLVPPMGDSRRGCISSRYIYILSTKFYGEKKKESRKNSMRTSSKCGKSQPFPSWSSWPFAIKIVKFIVCWLKKNIPFVVPEV